MLHLFVPLQQHGAAVVRGSLEASVDVLHQQVHAGLVQGAHRLLDVAALEAAHHFDHQQLRSVLRAPNTHVNGKLRFTQTEQLELLLTNQILHKHIFDTITKS